MDQFVALYRSLLPFTLTTRNAFLKVSKCSLMRKTTFYYFCAHLIFSFPEAQYSTHEEIPLNKSFPLTPTVTHAVHGCAQKLSVEHPPPAEVPHFRKTIFNTLFENKHCSLQV